VDSMSVVNHSIAAVLWPTCKKVPDEKTRFSRLVATGILASALGQEEERRGSRFVQRIEACLTEIFSV